jgi:pyruvate-formate lyase-activating enzyme
LISRAKKSWVQAVVADVRGEIFELDGYAAVGMDGVGRVPLTTDNTISLPFGSEMMLLPDRKPLVFDIESGQFEIVEENPYAPGEPVFPVAAFNSPGYVITLSSAYREQQGATRLPLFSYGAVGWRGRGFCSAAICVDREPRQDLRQMKPEDVMAGVRHMRKKLPQNRLRMHLEKCALTYGCPAGKNFFLGRYEAPLPTARHCNARCLGCISLQPEEGVQSSQERIGFTPSPEEIAQVALTHIRRVPRAVVSFGQGCEGDPLTAVDVIEPGIKEIRKRTTDGTINLNTNASVPGRVKQLCDAGLDSMRVSINSLRKACYRAYFNPKGYDFTDVMASIDAALERSRFVSINYLNCPGVTDTPEELEALLAFLGRRPIHMIQWRNLNFDPMGYVQQMNKVAPGSPAMGMENVLQRVRAEFPDLIFGYFNPPKESWPSGI